jgi:integrase
MGYAEKRGDYWRGRYKIAPGRYGTVTSADGTTTRFSTRRGAEAAANDAEGQVRSGQWRDPALGRITFGEYANRWYAAQDLAASTLQNYRRHIEEHLLPSFGELPMANIMAVDVDAWERGEREAGYAASSVKTWRGTLHLILADAVDESLLASNPATRRPGRGKRAGRSRHRRPEKAVTTPLGILEIAERCALLSGRDDEFVAVVTLGYTGLRWAELVGLETRYVREKTLRVEWQLYELDTGEFHRCPPKEDSHRTLDLPDWLAGMLSEQILRRSPRVCECHGQRYVFQGHGAPNGAVRHMGARLVDVARRAGLSTGTVSNVLNRPTTVPERTRERVQVAAAELGYVRTGATREFAAHWRRTGFAAWLFQPAATGWYPRRAPNDAHPVPVLADPWPGVPVRGRNASYRAEACWLPVAPGLTPHGLRHTHRTLMEEFGTPPTLMDERLGHEDGSVQARYSHVTPGMRRQLMAAFTQLWEASLDARAAINPHSPVSALDDLLRARAKARETT